ncbi:MAG TPA: LysR family transcriptional regulator [Paracoccaceae bacterium]|nr:LysR family transcriptional regulator [Paracoccaceae bacterium]HMO70980.1 LysR family transcriptional regulator [Paracoccaceae bacterium]
MAVDWRNLPPLSMLRAFEALGQGGGLTGAARRLNVTHPAIAQQVRALEDHLGLRLVLREGRGLRLTADGARLAAALADGFGTIEAALSALRIDGADRPVRITLTASFAAQWLMPRLRAFWDRHPEIGLSLHPDARVVDLTRDGFDLGIRYGAGNWPGVQARFLAPARLVVAGTPEVASAARADLSGADWILSRGWPEQDRFLESLGLDPAALSMTEISDETLALTAARQGLGLVVESAALVEDDVRAGRLEVVHDSRDRLPAYFVVTPPGAPRRPTQVFLTWLLAQA